MQQLWTTYFMVMFVLLRVLWWSTLLYGRDDAAHLFLQKYYLLSFWEQHNKSTYQRWFGTLLPFLMVCDIQFYFKISILRILVTFCHTFGWPNDLHQNQVCTGEIEVECHYHDCFLLHHYKSGKGQFCSKVNNCFLLSDEDSLKYKILIKNISTRLL